MAATGELSPITNPQSMLAIDPRASTALGELIVGIHGASSETAAYALVARHLPALLPAERASVALLLDNNIELELFALQGADGLVPVGVRLSVSQSMAGRATTTLEAITWTPMPNSPLIDSALLAADGMQSAVNVPLISSDQVLGTLNVGSVTPGAYSADQIQLLTQVAALVSACLERLRLLERMRAGIERHRAYAARLEVLNEIGRRLSMAMTESAIFSHVAHAVNSIMPAERVSYARRAADGLSVRVFGLVNNPANFLGPGSTLPLAGTGLGQVLQTGQPLVVTDLSRSLFSEHLQLAKSGLRAAMSLPIQVGGDTLGVLNVATRGSELNEIETQALLTAFARLMSSTIERVHAQEQMAATLRENEARIRGLIDGNPLMLVALDTRGIITRVSRFGASQLGYEAEELVGKHFAELHPLTERGDALSRLADILILSDDEVLTNEVRMLRRDGQVIWSRQSARVVRVGSSASELLLVCEDITEVKSLAEQLAEQARRDALTGLVNRREFDRQLERTVAYTRLGGRSACLLLFDVDHFKVINDTGGHQAGDALLRELVQRLQTNLSARDTLARLGGDEFTVLLEDCRLEDGYQVAERLRRVVEELDFTWEGKHFGVSLSIGVAVIDDHTQSAAQVVSDADAAMYASKEQGRNRVSVARRDNELIRRRRGEAEWVARIRAALAEERFLLMAQPIVPIRQPDDRQRYEVLVRMIDDDGRLIPPGAFLPAAERFSLASQIDQWVIRTVIARLVANPRALAITELCTINLSPSSLMAEDFIEFILQTIHQMDIPASKLCFELTETGTLAGATRTAQCLSVLSTLGCHFALDDFSFSSFGQLKQLAVDFIKINGTIVRDIINDRVDHAAVRSLQELAGMLNMQTIAEFVEDEAILASLREIGVDFAQGYSLGEPVPFDELLASF